MTLKNSKIYVIKTSPKSVFEDYRRLMQLADYEKHFKKNKPVLLKNPK